MMKALLKKKSTEINIKAQKFCCIIRKNKNLYYGKEVFLGSFQEIKVIS